MSKDILKIYYKINYKILFYIFSYNNILLIIKYNSNNYSFKILI